VPLFSSPAPVLCGAGCLATTRGCRQRGETLPTDPHSEAPADIDPRGEPPHGLGVAWQRTSLDASESAVGGVVFACPPLRGQIRERCGRRCLRLPPSAWTNAGPSLGRALSQTAPAVPCCATLHSIARPALTHAGPAIRCMRPLGRAPQALGPVGSIFTLAVPWRQRIRCMRPLGPWAVPPAGRDSAHWPSGYL